MAGRSSRRKGFGYEREIVNEFREHGLEAERMYGSNGASRGLPEEVDVVAEGKHFQAKRTKRIGQKYKPSNDIDGQIFREDYGESYVLIRLSDYIQLVKDAKSSAR